MTLQHLNRKKHFALFSKATPSDLCFGCFCFFCLLFLLANAELAEKAIQSGLWLCVKTIIPALFPFMVVSQILVYACELHPLFQKIFSPVAKFFRLGSAGTSALILGMLCGFPVGACICIKSLENGRMQKEEAERVLACCSNPSSAFLIRAVGISLWKNQFFGILLFVFILFSELLTAFFLRRFAPRTSKLPYDQTISDKKPFASVFTSALQSSAISMLYICAYVVFFSALTGTLQIAFDTLSINNVQRALTYCFFELSTGVEAAAAISSPILTAFAVGWSGLCVHCQLLSVCESTSLSFRKYFIAKFFQGLFCALLMFFFLCFQK